MTAYIRNLGLSIVTTLIIVFGTLQVHAEKPASPLTPFHVPDVQTISVCKYVSGNQGVDDQAEYHPLLFVNVKAIYVRATGDAVLSKLPAVSFFTPTNLALLAACTLQKRLTTKHNEATRGSSKPIYIPNDGAYRLHWPEAAEDGNLLVWVSVELLDSASMAATPYEKIVILRARYFRHDVNDVGSLAEQCSTAFPYKADTTELHNLLTRAMKVCLSKQYLSRAH